MISSTYPLDLRRHHDCEFYTNPAKKVTNKAPCWFRAETHRNGQWYKYIAGAVCYFGKIDNTRDAWDRYLFEKPYLESGRDVPENVAGVPNAISIGELTERFLETQKNRTDGGELASRTYRDYVRACDRLEKCFRKSRKVSDLRPRDFEELKKVIASAWGPVPTGNEIGRQRTPATEGDDTLGLPVWYGSD